MQTLNSPRLQRIKAQQQQSKRRQILSTISFYGGIASLELVMLWAYTIR